MFFLLSAWNLQGVCCRVGAWEPHTRNKTLRVALVGARWSSKEDYHVIVYFDTRMRLFGVCECEHIPMQNHESVCCPKRKISCWVGKVVTDGIRADNNSSPKWGNCDGIHLVEVGWETPSTVRGRERKSHQCKEENSTGCGWRERKSPVRHWCIPHRLWQTSWSWI